MKICFFTPIFPPKYSGATFQAITLAKALREKGCSILFVSLSDYGEVQSVFEGFEVYYIPVKNHATLIEGTASTLDYLDAILKLFLFLFKLRKKFSIIHSHILGYPYIFLSLAGKILGKKTVAKVTMSKELDFEYIGRIQGKFAKFFSLRFDRLIAISTTIRNKLEYIGTDPKKIIFIPNSVDTNKFYPLTYHERRSLKKRLGIKKKIVISFVGGITFRKGIHDLVQWWPEVVKAFPESILLLIGPKVKEEGIIADRFCYEEAKEALEKAHMENNVIFTGKVSNVNEYLQISDLFVFPSTLEGMPNVVLEAMACGVPPVSYRISGVDDIIRPGVDGQIIEVGDSVSFKNAVINLLENSSKRKELSKNAYHRIMDSFIVDKVSKKYIYLYKDLLEQI